MPVRLSQKELALEVEKVFRNLQHPGDFGLEEEDFLSLSFFLKMAYLGGAWIRIEEMLTIGS